MPTVHDVADYLLWLADRDRLGVDHLKLQKLVYYTQAFHLGNENEPLFPEEIRAWQYGPVCPDLWNTYRYRRDYLEPPETPGEQHFTSSQLELLTLVHERFRELSGIELIQRTHQEDPWMEADSRSRDGGSDSISHQSMQRYFRGRLWVLVENQEAPPPPNPDTIENQIASAVDPRSDALSHAR